MNIMDIRMLKKILEWIISILIAVVFAISFKYYIATSTKVEQISMFPTLKQGEKLWLDRTIRITKKLPKRGDIITFEETSKKKLSIDELDISNPIIKYEEKNQNNVEKFLYYVLELNKKSYIKRVIALPGEKVEIKDGKVFVNDKELVEDYLNSEVITKIDQLCYNNFIVPKNCVFTMGDNREKSIDSRNFGCVPIDKIEGIVICRIWPLNNIGKI